MSYRRFAAMIVTSMVVMHVLTYVTTYRLSDVEFSETRLYMSLLMGGAMAIIMLAFMLGMYRNRRANMSIFVGSAVLIAGAAWLVRSQAAVEDTSFMRAMIPHHSVAMLTSERAQLEDVRVCELAADISQAQREEIVEMRWLVEDIADHGPATTAAEAERRAAPDVTREPDRSC